MNDGMYPYNVEHNFGIIRNVNDPMGKYAPKPAYVAYGTMARQIADKPFLKKETVIDGKKPESRAGRKCLSDGFE